MIQNVCTIERNGLILLQVQLFTGERNPETINYWLIKYGIQKA